MSDKMLKVENKNKKSSRSILIASGFIAIYFVIFAVIGSICMPIPVLYLLMPSLIALFSAPVYMLIITKCPKHGPVFIASVLPGLFLLLQGNIWVVVLTSVISGILAEVIVGFGKFKSWKLNTISYLFFTENLIGGFLPIWIMRDYYFSDTMERGMSTEFCNLVEKLTPLWVLFAQIGSVVLLSLLGCIFSKKIFTKHFKKAGII